jgi:hypothetical protein
MVGACTAVVDAEEFPQFPHFALPPPAVIPKHILLGFDQPG